MSSTKRESPHILYYIMEMDKAIRNGQYPNAQTFKAEWGLSRSTVCRYIDVLRDTYMAPIEFDFKRNGYYYSDNTFFIQNVMLKEGELLTLSTLFPMLEQYKNTPLEESFKNIMSKIMDMLPDSISVDSSLINNEVHFISEPTTYLKEGIFDTILKATKTHRTLELQYKSATNTNYEKRFFDPYHIICQQGSWYVLGYSHTSNAIRTYAMPRIDSAKMTEKVFKIAPDFKLTQHIDPEFGIYNSADKKTKIEIEFDSTIKTYVMEREWHKNQELHENADGTVYLAFETNQLEQAARWVLQFAGAAKVINPPELKELVSQAAKKILSTC